MEKNIWEKQRIVKLHETLQLGKMVKKLKKESLQILLTLFVTIVLSFSFWISLFANNFLIRSIGVFILFVIADGFAMYTIHEGK